MNFLGLGCNCNLDDNCCGPLGDEGLGAYSDDPCVDYNGIPGFWYCCPEDTYLGGRCICVDQNLAGDEDSINDRFCEAMSSSETSTETSSETSTEDSTESSNENSLDCEKGVMCGDGPFVLNIKPLKQKDDLIVFSATLSPCYVFDYDHNQEANLQIVIPNAKWFDDANAEIGNITDTEPEWNESFKRINKIDRRRFFIINKNDSIKVKINLEGIGCKVNDNFDPELYLYPKGNINKNIILRNPGMIPTFVVLETHKFGDWSLSGGTTFKFILKESETVETKEEDKKSTRIIDIREERKNNK